MNMCILRPFVDYEQVEEYTSLLILVESYLEEMHTYVRMRTLSPFGSYQVEVDCIRVFKMSNHLNLGFTLLPHMM